MALAVTKVGKALLARARRLKEDLHRHARLGSEERRTAVAVAVRQRGLDEVRTGVAQTGMVAVLQTRASSI